ncbi:MAG TPA: RNA 2'-phosphotransferase [Allosphingosinicella sp.]
MAGGEDESGAPLKQVSKFLALILRHKPEAGGLSLDPEGWAPVDAVLAAVRARFGAFGREDLGELVRTNDKKRYAFDGSGTRIRASQGHSIGVDLGLRPTEPPPLLYHGTTRRFLASILASGLVRGKRHHVHLSEDQETATIVGARRAGETIVLAVDSGAMHADGHLFFLSANRVWLTNSVPPEFLKLADLPPR